MSHWRRTLPGFYLVVLSASMCPGQGWRNYASPDGIIVTEEGVPVNELTVRTAREIASHSTGTPEWTNASGFEKDVFTFVRIIRDRNEDDSPTSGSWITDFPDSDLNLSFRLQQMTSLKVDPDGRVMRLSDPDLLNFPWIYMVEPGALLLRDEEVAILRRYLLNGGVLMADDFWGEWQWKAFHREMKRVLPERDFEELPMNHPIFHCVFDLTVPKNRLQTPNIGQGVRSQYDDVTWEYHPREGQWRGFGYGWRGNRPGWEACTDMHVRAITDDKKRIMVIATHNCDNGDGWEREGENDFFFHEYSEKRAFPLGINVIFYLMTH